MRELESNLQKAVAADLANQNRDLEAKRKKRNELLQLKKMQIEANQVDEINKKEVETISNKFYDQMTDMDKHVEKDVDREVRNIMTRVGPGKEEALIVVNEAFDDLLERKLKILMSKQFSDLTMYLGSMNKKAATEQMIRDRKIELKFKALKDTTLREQLPEAELAEKLQIMEAEKELELQLSSQKGNHDREERE
mmetsp:Transcript_4563/g.6039  ORF Transcript_4563/g.6039 Transcript_4563/m.6039 type:complete len:195 (-) Transcript_4563:1484-2068(-)